MSIDEIRKRHKYDEACERLLAPHRTFWARLRSVWARQVHKDRATLLAKLDEYEKWFSDHATVLATHRIGGYSFEEPKL